MSERKKKRYDDDESGNNELLLLLFLLLLYKEDSSEIIWSTNRRERMKINMIIQSTYFSIPYYTITIVIYGAVSGKRRTEEAIFIIVHVGYS